MDWDLWVEGSAALNLDSCLFPPRTTRKSFLTRGDISTNSMPRVMQTASDTRDWVRNGLMAGEQRKVNTRLHRPDGRKVWPRAVIIFALVFAPLPGSQV